MASAIIVNLQHFKILTASTVKMTICITLPSLAVIGQTISGIWRSCDFWATVCKTVRPMLSVRCLFVLSVLSCLSVTFVHCGQTVGRIKTKLGTQVVLGHIVLDGDPVPPPPKGLSHPIFGPFLLWPNGSMHQNATWYGCWPHPRGGYVRWRPSPPSPIKGRSSLLNFKDLG